VTPEVINAQKVESTLALPDIKPDKLPGKQLHVPKLVDLRPPPVTAVPDDATPVLAPNRTSPASGDPPKPAPPAVERATIPDDATPVVPHKPQPLDKPTTPESNDTHTPAPKPDPRQVPRVVRPIAPESLPKPANRSASASEQPTPPPSGKSDPEAAHEPSLPIIVKAKIPEPKLPATPHVPPASASTSLPRETQTMRAVKPDEAGEAGKPGTTGSRADHPAKSKRQPPRKPLPAAPVQDTQEASPESSGAKPATEDSVTPDPAQKNADQPEETS
jgi:hypothetical protein